jgi:uncharacterized protein YbjT (DUF2867 family)
MPRALVTGGTGDLGSHTVPRLKAAGFDVRISSRRPRPDGADPSVEWAEASLESGQGLAAAVAGVDVILHCASAPFRKTEQADVEGTGRLLGAARDAGVSHFLYISIVGIDRIPLPYYRHKLAAEARIEESGVPYSILRAVQFHALIDRFLSALVRLPVALVPGSFKFQPIDTGEVADRLVEAALAGPGGRLEDIGGPAVRSYRDLTGAWLKGRRKRALILPAPVFGKVASGFRAGLNCVPENTYGKVTFEQWLESKYGSDKEAAK